MSDDQNETPVIDPILRALGGVYDQSWIAEWTKDREWAPNDEGVAWLRERPKELHPLMVDFPPSCVVRAKKPLLIPAQGTCGVVRSWFEPSEKNPRGLVGICQTPHEGEVRAQCSPEDLEVVGFWCGWTHERVKAVLFPQNSDSSPGQSEGGSGG